MTKISKPRSHFVFAVLQSGLTSLVAAGVASFGRGTGAEFAAQWLKSWLVAWALMIPLVLLAAPYIRALARRIAGEH